MLASMVLTADGIFSYVKSCHSP